MRILLAVAIATLGAGCAANHCRSTAEACAQTTDCCDGLVCLNGSCEMPVVATCPADAPIDCGAILPGQCCQRSNPICCAKDGACHISAADCNGPSSCANKACTTSAGCCAGFTCARFGHLCHIAAGLALGDACTADSQCISKSCSDYCTMPCATSVDCGGANYCLASATVTGFSCIPFCRSDADCALYGPNTTCQSSTDPTGLTLKGCFAR